MVREKRWVYPGPDVIARTHMTPEDLDIAQGPRPVKPAHVLAAEDELHRLRADVARRPADTIPDKLHYTREVDELGAPQMAEAFLRYLSNERSSTFEERCMVMVLRDLRTANRPLWAVLEERFFYGRTTLAIAEQMGLSEWRVRHLCFAGMMLVQRNLAELVGSARDA